MYEENFICNFESNYIMFEDVFFDIETTGLSPKESFIYLICIAKRNSYTDQLIGTLLLADSFSEEESLIREFISRIEGAKRLIGYNSDRFDINFIKTRASGYNISFDNSFESLDLYKTVRSLKSIIGLPNLQLKTVEYAFGIRRNDVYSGGELIEVYRDYAAALSFSRCLDNKTGKFELEPLKNLCLTNLKTLDYISLRKVLLLHNTEDVTSLFTVFTELISLKCFIDGGFSIKEESVAKTAEGLCRSENESSNAASGFISTGIFSFVIETDILLYKGYLKEYQSEDLRIKRLSAGSFLIEVTLLHDELKLYFPDYKNYFYFPSEDMAIHKALAGYSGSSEKIPAKKETCYIKKTGSFVPVFNCTEYSHVLMKSHNDVKRYILIEDAKKDLVKYASSLLKSL